MIAPIKQPTHKKTIKLLPQETEGTYQFAGKFVATPAAIQKFGDAVIVGAHIMLQKAVKQSGVLPKNWSSLDERITEGRSIF